MWFKNLKTYLLTEDLKTTPEEISEKLSDHGFRHCGKQELATMGWVSPIDGGQDLVHAAGNRVWLKLKKQERLLPASVINAELAEKVEQIEKETGYPVSKKQQSDIKQEIMHKLLPQAFTKNSYIEGVLCLEEKLVLVDASADGKAETFLAMLRKALESLPVLPIAKQSEANLLTDWVANNTSPAAIEVLEEAELKDTSGENECVIRCKNQDLSAPEIANHLEAGKQVVKLGIQFGEAFTGTIEEDLSLKRIKFTDMIKEENDDIPKDQLAAKQDADFTLTVSELIKWVDFLAETFEVER